MSIPNKITLFRLILTPFAVGFLFTQFPYHYLVALGIFIIGATSDLIDGYIARKYNQETKLGRFLDPVVDKVFNYSLIITLLSFNIFPLWIVLLLFARELLVDAFMSLSVQNNIYIKALYPGKFKSFFVSIGIILGELSLEFSSVDLRNAAYFLLIIALIVGFIGSTDVLYKAWQQMDTRHKK